MESIHSFVTTFTESLQSDRPSAKHRSTSTMAEFRISQEALCNVSQIFINDFLHLYGWWKVMPTFPTPLPVIPVFSYSLELETHLYFSEYIVFFLPCPCLLAQGQLLGLPSSVFSSVQLIVNF